jgi:hypothetical protein
VQTTARTAEPGASNCLLPLRVVFAVTEVGEDAAAGDLFTAMELGAALAKRFGWQVDYRPQGDAWYALAGVDVVIAMVDDFDPRCIHGSHPGLVKVAWARNWFERWCERAWFGAFDLCLASSQLSARYVSSQLGKLANILRIGTNPQRFTSDNRPQVPSLDYVFTGSYWGSDRDVASALGALSQELRGAIYGKNWQAHPHLARLDKGFVRYADLPDVYRRAAIVIDDANHVTKAWGAANSRVFDALAAGCLVITNSESVSADAFDGVLPVYRSSDDLVQLVSHYANDQASRTKLQERLRNLVLAKHCYAHRAFEFGWHLERYLTRERSGFGAEELLAKMHGPGNSTSTASLRVAT